MRVRLYVGLILGLTVALVGAGCGQVSPTPAPDMTSETVIDQPFRLFLVRSYGDTDPWSNRVRAGILEKLAQSGYDQTLETLILEEFALQAERLTDAAEIEMQVEAAIQSIQEFNPDVVILIDDEAAHWLINAYPDAQKFVFCGLNSTSWEQEFDRSDVTGVLEIPYPVETVRVAESMMRRPPNSVLLLTDASMAGVAEAATVQEILADTAAHPVEELLVYHTDEWQEWQRIILEEASAVDLVLLGHHSTLQDAAGEPVLKTAVLEWTLDNSSEPVFGLRLNTISNGAVGGLAVSGYEQGRRAAELALSVLHGEAPSSLPVRGSEHNVLAVNIAAANYWDLDVPVEFLIAARVERYFPIAAGGQ